MKLQSHDAAMLRAAGLIPPARKSRFVNVSHALRGAASIITHHWYKAYYWYCDHIDIHLVRYNRFDVKTLPRSWSDVCYSLPHVLFHMLTEFVEGEEPFDNADWDYTPEHQFAAEEILELYNWWIHDPYAQQGIPAAVYPTSMDDDVGTEAIKAFPPMTETVSNYIRRLEHEGRDLPPDHLYWKCLTDYKKVLDSRDLSRRICDFDGDTNESKKEYLLVAYTFVHLLEAAAEDKIDQMSIRLIKVRKYLWT